MKAAGGGVIINISSTNAELYCGKPTYSAARSAIINLTKAVATEYGKYGTRWNTMVPASTQADALTWAIRQE